MTRKHNFLTKSHFWVCKTSSCRFLIFATLSRLHLSELCLKQTSDLNVSFKWPIMTWNHNSFTKSHLGAYNMYFYRFLWMLSWLRLSNSSHQMTSIDLLWSWHICFFIVFFSDAESIVLVRIKLWIDFVITCLVFSFLTWSYHSWLGLLIPCLVFYFLLGLLILCLVFSPTTSRNFLRLPADNTAVHRYAHLSPTTQQDVFFLF